MTFEQLAIGIKKTKISIHLIAEEITDGREGRVKINSVAQALYKIKKGETIPHGNVREAISQYAYMFKEFEY